MAKIKSVSNYNGTSWDTPIPLGADDANIDITSATTDPTTDTTATAAGLIAADVVAGEGDTDATAWTKFNKFRRRVYNAFNGVAGITVANSLVSSSGSSKVYSAGYINNYMTNVVGHSGTTTPTNGTIIDQLDTTNQNLNNRVAKTGDTMTGKLINNVAFTNAIMDIDKEVTPETTKSYDALEVIDKNSSILSIHRVMYGIDGNITTIIGTRRHINNSSVFSTINLGVTPAGEQTVSVSNPAAWRSTLGLGTDGALPVTVEQGGTGQAGVSTTTTISSIASALSGVTIVSASFSQWGKVGHLYLTCKLTSALSSASKQVATLVSGKRPVTFVMAGTTQSNHAVKAVINSAGAITIDGTLAADVNIIITATYLLL